MPTMRSVALLATCLGVLGPARPAAACGYGMPSPVARFALADCVVVGRVTLVEPRPVLALFPGSGQRLAYNVAVLKVQEMIKGDPRLTHVRVGLLAHQSLLPGFEACFFLQEHPEESFFLQGSDFYDYPVAREGNPGFAAQVETFRRLGRLSGEPLDGLRAARAEDRFLAAALFVARCRTFRPTLHAGADRTEPVDALSSRLVLRALAEADWSRGAADFSLNPRRVFLQLGLSARDGWNPPAFRDLHEMEAFARKWLRENEDKVLLRAFVRR